MACDRRCQGVRVTLLPQQVGIPVPAHGVRVCPASARPGALAGAGLPRLTGPRLPRVTSPGLPSVAGARLALTLALLALACALLALAVALLALTGARLPVAMPVRVPARAVLLGA
jgi:hypothetical protein